MTKTQKVYLEFSVDYDQDIEDVSVFEVDDEDKSSNIDFRIVKNFLNKLVKEVKNFHLSIHRTEIQVSIENEKMTINYQTYNSPDWNDYYDMKIENIEPISIDYI
jgi:hypothetical protein